MTRVGRKMRVKTLVHIGWMLEAVLGMGSKYKFRKMSG